MAMKERIFLVSIIVILIIGIVSIINIYENKILRSQSYVAGGKKIKLNYTASEIKALIKVLPMYQKDSITIFEDGKIESNSAEVNSGLGYNQKVEVARLSMEKLAKQEKMPLPYIIYREVAIYVEAQKKLKEIKK